MKVTQEQFNRATTVADTVRKNSHGCFLEVKPRMIRWILDDVGHLKPAHLKQVEAFRMRFEEIFQQHYLDNPTRELVVRLLVLGSDAIFKSISAVKDPVEIVAQQHVAKETEQETKGSLLRLEGSSWDLDKLLDVLGNTEPFQSERKRFKKELGEAPSAWKVLATTDGKISGARANKKNNAHELCEDGALLANMRNLSGNVFQLAAVMDGISMNGDGRASCNITKWIFNEVLGERIRNAFEDCVRKTTRFPAQDQITSGLLSAVADAQDEVTDLLPELISSFEIHDKKYNARISQSDMKLAYLRARAGATTLELVLMCPELKKGIHFKVGDGQTLLVTIGGAVRNIGPDMKQSNHMTSGISVYRSRLSIVDHLDTTPFKVEPTDAVMVMTDGPGDNAGKTDEGKQQMANAIWHAKNGESAVEKLCFDIDLSKLKKPDDFGFVVIR